MESSTIQLQLLSNSNKPKSPCWLLTCPETRYTRKGEAQSTWKQCHGKGCQGPLASLAVRKHLECWFQMCPVRSRRKQCNSTEGSKSLEILQYRNLLSNNQRHVTDSIYRVHMSKSSLPFAEPLRFQGIIFSLARYSYP